MTRPGRIFMAKVVIDANVIVSAAFGGKPLEAAIRAMGKREVYISREIERELMGIVAKLSKKLTEEQQHFVRDRIRQLMAIAAVVTVSTHITLSRDAQDDHYLSLCKRINADFLITGDKDLLNIPEGKLKKAGISTRIVNPNEFLQMS